MNTEEKNRGKYKKKYQKQKARWVSVENGKINEHRRKYKFINDYINEKWINEWKMNPQTNK